MKRILAAFLVTWDLDSLTPGELQNYCIEKLDFSFFRKIITPSDEAALETALCLADEYRSRGEPCTVSAVVCGACERRFIWDLFSVGFDEIVCVNPDASDMDLDHAAWGFAQYLKQFPLYDAVLIGSRHGTAYSNRLPLLLSGLAGLPCLTEVTSVHAAGEGFRVCFLNGMNTMQADVSGPILLSVGLAEHQYLRSATLRMKMRTKSRKETLFEADMPPRPVPPACLDRRPASRSRTPRFVTGESDDELARQLWDIWHEDGRDGS